jgi:hypothetical protein
MEIFKEIKGYEGLYLVSSFGYVKSVEHVIIRSDGRKRTIKEKIKEGTHNKGYKRIALVNLKGQSKNYYVHRIVAAAFIGESDLYVDHINGHKKDNRFENLRYCTNSENLTFRNTKKEYTTKIPYIYYDKARNKYKVYKSNKRFDTLEQAKEALNVYKNDCNKQDKKTK